MDDSEKWDDFEDKDDEESTFDDVELSWENYPSFEKVVVDDNSTLIVIFSNDFILEQSFKQIQKWIKRKFPNSTTTSDEYGDKLIVRSDVDICSMSQIFNCLMCRFFENNTKSDVMKYLEDNFQHNSESFVKIKHVDEKFQLSSEFMIHSRTGWVKHEGGYLLFSYWNIYKKGIHVSKVLFGYCAYEMSDCTSTIIMFEIFPEYRRHGIGESIIINIECEMYKRGFKKLRLENTYAIPFWVNLGYAIDIDEGEKELDDFNCNGSSVMKRLTNK